MTSRIRSASRSRSVVAVLAGVVTACVMGAGASSAVAAAVLDANCPGPPNTTGNVPANQRLAQTFTAKTTGTLVQGEIEVEKTGGTGDWVMEIYATDPTGAPTNSVLASTTIADATVPIGQVRLVGTFSPGASVVAGQQYAISLRRAASWVPHDRSGDTCPGTEFSSTTPSGTWVEVPGGYDLVFAVFVEPEPQPTAKADGTLTIDANKGKVEKGRKVTLSGQYDVTANEACEPNRSIEIQRRKKSQPDTAFKTFTTVQTDATGNFSTKKKVKKTSFYRAVVQETAACDDESSNTQKVRVQKKKAAQEA